tara:strand:- start:1309 stop:1617 length:309 start_codon:yes stop_codon:yes gene_type:complete
MTLTKKELENLIASPFWNQLTHQLESGEFVNVNGAQMPHAIWNLMVSKRDLTMWCKVGMKPHRRWKVSDVKTYFNITGSRSTLLSRFNKIYEHIMRERNDSL